MEYLDGVELSALDRDIMMIRDKLNKMDGPDFLYAFAEFADSNGYRIGTRDEIHAFCDWLENALLEIYDKDPSLVGEYKLADDE